MKIFNNLNYLSLSMAEVITSEVLYDILRKEKVSTEIQPLDKNFYKNIIKYMQEKENLIQTQRNNPMFSKEVIKIEKEIDAIKRMIKELYERREAKIIQNALFSSRAKNKDEIIPLVNEEKRFYQSILDTVELYRKSVLENVLVGKIPVIEEIPKSIKTDDIDSQKEENRLVRIIHPIPKFVGTDLNIYGPFEQEDVSLLPRKVADLLINKNRAEEIKIENS